MIWFLAAALCLLASVICFICWLVLRKKMRTVSAQSEAPGAEGITVLEGKSQNNPAYEKKAKRALIVGVILLVLTEAAILIADKVTV